MPRKSPPLPSSSQPARAEPRKAVLHPRNRHTGRYDFPALIASCPELAEHVIVNPYGKQSIDFANPDAVRVFNRALLRQFYGIKHWDIPPGYLCPPVPGRADYLHGLADLLGKEQNGAIPQGGAIRALDIGTGANCIYPLIGNREYGWHFTGSDIDATALASARTIVSANGLAKAIELRQQAAPRLIFKGVVLPEERFDLTLCNPPFHASQAEANSGSQRKWRNLGKLDPSRKLPALNFGGQAAELWCDGGEVAFISRMAEESAQFAGQVYWFSTLVSKGANVAPLVARLKRLGARQVHTLDMAQGQKKSRFVAWTFLSEADQANWRAERWQHR
ncbi:23S rRNA (adenine(1618)-N(6))-methyltransferase RlmF [Stutzerimonas stutzeri]|uniref:Ribosomal RNA large subunit methyltransferase F n=1 Tax=Stutzerimonas stutzeri TaxID=316 RepID=A0A2S4AJQ8_STUST|nr:23S rRNA (adenine(1618)-N(6))-methyltransferase RlmF [Stutzerimonas stutzeri]MCQ4263854.1 23S rRNA (adenine(1618)-N(6))-methyltransferase RlmF [Stutzerimonas stutzeri]POH81237.1 23S rRNA (adenine(1618)-N(6))-methyltransferase RlmF [Stutzerimonas stutzeri]